VAVSDDSDPAGTWYGVAIDSKTSISGSDHWADYPGLAVDDKAVYVTANVIAFGASSSTASRLWVIHKGIIGGLYAGSGATVTVHDPAGSTGVPGSITMQPGHMFGTPPTGMGSFLVRYSGATDGVAEYLSIIRVDDPLGSSGGPTFSHQFVSLGDIDATATSVPGAPQKDSSATIDAGDRRALQAVWRDDALWVTATINPSAGTDAGQATAHWFKVNTTTLSSLTLSDQGNIGGEDIATGAYTYYPSVAVDALGNMCVGFAASGSTIYPGAYFTGRQSTDPAGTTLGSGVLRAGVDAYVRKLGGSRNRWGDYSGTSLDPSDGSFWIFNEYAMSQGTSFDSLPGETGRWKTAFGNLSPSSLPIQLASSSVSVLRENPAGAQRGWGIEVAWRTLSETNNFGFEIYRKRESGDSRAGGSQWQRIAFIKGQGTTLTPQSYTYVDESVGFGEYSYQIRQTDLDGNSKVFPEMRILVGVSPDKLFLAQNYPNPFNAKTVIEFAVPRESYTTLKVYSILGQQVAQLFEGNAEAGVIHSVSWEASTMAGGVYFYVLRSVGTADIKRMLLMK
jgi:hypothetical protein